jgi:hypothetical protein
MSPLEQTLLIVTSKSPPLRRALQRWALRYAGRLLFKLGGVNLASADLLQALGEATGEHTSADLLQALDEATGEHTLIGRPPSIREPATMQGTMNEGPPSIRPPAVAQGTPVQGTMVGRPPSIRPPAPPTKQPPARSIQRDVWRDVWRQDGSYETHEARKRDLAGALGIDASADWVLMINHVKALLERCR